LWTFFLLPKIILWKSTHFNYHKLGILSYKITRVFWKRDTCKVIKYSDNALVTSKSCTLFFCYRGFFRAHTFYSPNGFVVNNAHVYYGSLLKKKKHYLIASAAWSELLSVFLYNMSMEACTWDWWFHVVSLIKSQNFIFAQRRPHRTKHGWGIS